MKRRGAVLFELVVSIAVFVGAGTLTLSVLHNGYTAIDQAHRKHFAIDLAKSKLAELDAGLLSIGDLQSLTIETVGSIDLVDVLAPGAQLEQEWLIDIDTEPTEFRGLTLVRITVFTGSTDDSPSITLRQLVRLREERIDEYEEDDLLDGLPQGEGP